MTRRNSLLISLAALAAFPHTGSLMKRCPRGANEPSWKMLI